MASYLPLLRLLDKVPLQELCVEIRASLVAQSVKNLPAVQDIRARSLGLNETLEKEMATHSSVLAWKISWIRGAC